MSLYGQVRFLSEEESLAIPKSARKLPSPAAHKYVSTYCVHDLHGDCRLTCKHCEAPCLCPCHKAASS